jgi:hypothetical protein
MLMRHKFRSNNNPANRTYTFTRNNLEFAGIVVYFFAVAVFFAMTLIVMLFQAGDETNVRAAHDHRPNGILGQRFHRS